MAGQYRSVDTGQSFPALEERILGWWKENSIFEKSMELRAGNPEWVFYEGPPTANGKPGVHHVLARIFKDIYPRYKTMQGFYVGRKAGWDCHGLPVELEIEKRLGFDHKEQIEAYGVAAFNKLCKESVLAYVDDWNRMTERIGMWLDLDDPYITMTDSYIESVWWILSEFAKQGLLYEGYKVVPYCPRCGTALSSHEVASGYQMVTDPSVFVRFPLVDGDASGRRAPLAGARSWPRTACRCRCSCGPPLPGPSSPTWPRPSARTSSTRRPSSATSTSSWPPTWSRPCSAPTPSSRRPIPARTLVGKHYAPPYHFVTPDKPAWRIIAADYVATDEGSGIVHIAPAFGADDMIVGQAERPARGHARGRGGPLHRRDHPLGRHVRQRRRRRHHGRPRSPRPPGAPPALRAQLSLLLALRHAPHLLRQGLLVRPDHRPQGRRAERQRGGHLASRSPQARPLRQVAREQHRLVALPRPLLGHAAPGLALRQRATTPWSAPARNWASWPAPTSPRLELHRPYVDEVTFACPECGAEAKRVTSVIDAWFDSGSMPVAQWHYPFENRDMFEKRFPADFICEAIDQTRGWFYSLLAISALLTGPHLLQERALPGPHPRQRRPQDVQAARQRRRPLEPSSTSKAPTPCAGTCSPPARPGSRAASAPRTWTRSSASSSSPCGTPTRSTRSTPTSTASTRPRTTCPWPSAASWTAGSSATCTSSSRR